MAKKRMTVSQPRPVSWNFRDLWRALNELKNGRGAHRADLPRNLPAALEEEQGGDGADAKA